jgi:hypothetical protein
MTIRSNPRSTITVDVCGLLRTSRFAAFEALLGSYFGAGVWIDITGKSKRYRIQQSIEFKGDELTLESVVRRSRAHPPLAGAAARSCP